jgi:anti-sigma B factor antagonist
MGKLRMFDTLFEGTTLVIAPTGPVSNLAVQDMLSEVGPLQALVESDECHTVLVDMGKVTFFGSVLLGVLNSLSKHIRQRQGRFVLCGLSQVGGEVIHATRFDTLWPIYPSREEALKALGEEK